MASERQEVGRRRAGALGLALTALCTLLGGALLHWSGSHVKAAGWGSVPVNEAVNWCVAAVAGVIALALACCCLLGVRHLLRPVPSPPHPLCLREYAPWLASRAAAVLMTITLGSTSALANPTTEPLFILDTHRSAISTAPTSAATTSTRLPQAPATPDGPTDTVVAVPDWRPVRAELPVPTLTSPGNRPTSRSVRSHARAQTNRTIPSHASGLADRPAREQGADSVVVRRGDNLWRITAQELGPDASDAHIAARWPKWYSANRLTIGPDPNRILPGQILERPGASPALPTIGEQP